jgi:uncharacterized MAPEG superfamily protein
MPVSAMPSATMTVPLWGVVIFILWTIAVVVLLLAVRLRHLAQGGSPKDFGTPDDGSLLWRLYRTQANLVENLPLYLGVVFLLTVQGVVGPAVDALVAVYIGARLVHSAIHIAGLNPTGRLISLGVQLSCLIALIALAVLSPA